MWVNFQDVWFVKMLWVEVVFDVVENLVAVWCKVCRKIEHKEIVGSQVGFTWKTIIEG